MGILGGGSQSCLALQNGPKSKSQVHGPLFLVLGSWEMQADPKFTKPWTPRGFERAALHQKPSLKANAAAAAAA